MGGGCLQEVVAKGGSTLIILIDMNLGSPFLKPSVDSAVYFRTSVTCYFFFSDFVVQ